MALEGSGYKSVVLASNTAQPHNLCRQLLDEVKANEYDEDDIFAIHLALEEAFINAVKHGNKQDPGKHVGVEYMITPEKFDITITDQGSGFDPDSIPDPRSEENLYKLCGRGMLLMQSYMDLVEYNDIGNSVHMVKNRAKVKKMSTG